MSFDPPKWLPATERSRFLRNFYATVDPEDLAAADGEKLAAIAWSLLAFGRRRRPRQTLVRVFNATLHEHGYTSPHSIVEMVGDDMPFLVDSIGLALARRGLALHFLAHPILAAARDASGRLRELKAREAGSKGARRLESLQHIEIDRIVGADALQDLAAEIARNLDDVRVACEDWPKMQAVLRETAAALSDEQGQFDARDVSETRALLAWMAVRHFTFLGYREYRLRGGKGRESLVPLEATGLGLLRAGHRPPDSTGRILASDIRRQSRSRDLALVTKANIAATVHRPGYLDYVGVKQFTRDGRLIGERRFLGLWTSAAYNSTPREIPLLRHKVLQVARHFEFAPDSHDGKTLQHILETFPRDELFQASVPELIRSVTGILGLQERPRVRFLARRDPFRRFYSCLIYVPREKYNSQVRERIEKLVGAACAAQGLESQIEIAQSNLARLHIVARTQPTGEHAGMDPRRIEKQIEAAVRSWNDDLKATLLARFDEAYALRLFEKYGPAFQPPMPRIFPRRSRPTTCPSSRRPTGSRRDCIWTSIAATRAGAISSFSRFFAAAAPSRSRTSCRCSSTWACA